MTESVTTGGNYIVVANAKNVAAEMDMTDCLPIMERRGYSVPSITIMTFMDIKSRCVGNTIKLQGITRTKFYGRQVAGILNQKQFNKKEMKNDSSLC